MNKISLLLGVLLVIAIGIAGFFWWQTQQNNPSQALGPYTPSVSEFPTPVPSVAEDETANWKTFTNLAWNYSFEYPENYEVQGNNQGSPEENLEVDVVSTRALNESKTYLDYPFLRVLVDNDVTATLEMYAKSSFEGNKKNNTQKSNLEKYSNGHVEGWQYDFSATEFNFTNVDEVTGQPITGGGGFLISKPGIMKIVFLQDDENVYTLILNGTSPFNQILSTFKFTN